MESEGVVEMGLLETISMFSCRWERASESLSVNYTFGLGESPSQRYYKRSLNFVLEFSHVEC